MSFENLGLAQPLLKAIKECGYTVPTEIQSEAIPIILEGNDVRGSAQTGSGKTGAFLLPALSKLAEDTNKKHRGPRLLILAPTRELGAQIALQAAKYAKHLPHMKIVSIFGGVPYPKQLRDLKKPYDVLIATPGRLIDHLQRKTANLSNIQIAILDEADRMLDMGFMEPVSLILDATPDDRQTLLFSATFDRGVKKLSDTYMKSPVDLAIHSQQTRHENIEQHLHFVDDINHKNRLLNHILRKDELQAAIVFTATKRSAAKLVDQLYDEGHLVGALHGDMNQRQRTRTIQNLKKGKFNILVATDVAARGLDVDSITHVINFDLPRQTEDYVHRIGRTGRAGAKGTALSFAAHADRPLLTRIEQFTGHKINVSTIEGLEPKLKPSPAAPKGPKRFGGPKRGKRPFPPKRAGGGGGGKGPFPPRRGRR